MKTKFILVSGPYETKRNGIVVLHRLLETLVGLGYEVHVLFMHVPGSQGKLIHTNNPAFYNPVFVKTMKVPQATSSELRDIIQTGVVIYPEIIVGNPLGARNVCRYLLNKEGALQGKSMQASESDFVFSFSRLFVKPDQEKFVLFCPPDLDWAKDMTFIDTERRSFDSFYIGKGARYHSAIEPPKHFVELTRDWPKTQADFRAVLSATRIFMSYDILSASNMDALLAGALPVVSAGRAPFSVDEVRNSELGFFCLSHDQLPELLKEGLSGTLLQTLQATRQLVLNNAQRYEEAYVGQVQALVNKIGRHFSF